MIFLQRSWQHPLQPFSRRYFELASGLSTYAREWHAAHEEGEAQALPEVAAFVPDPEVPLTLARLTDFLRNPARNFLRNRLLVRLEQEEEVLEDDELFSVDGLTAYGLINQLQQGVRTQLAQSAAMNVDASVQQQVQRLARSGVLPLAGMGAREAQALQQQATPSMLAWQQQMQEWPYAAPRQRLRLADRDLILDDWIDGLRERDDEITAGDGALAEPFSSCWLALEPRTLLNKKGELQAHKMLSVYVRSLALSATGASTLMGVIARDALVWVVPLEAEEARQHLLNLMQLWLQGQNEPLPMPLRSSLAAANDDLGAAAQAYEGGFATTGECQDPSWARCYPDWEALTGDLRFEHLAKQVYAPMLQWLEAHVMTDPLPTPALTGEQEGEQA